MQFGDPSHHRQPESLAAVAGGWRDALAALLETVGQMWQIDCTDAPPGVAETYFDAVAIALRGQHNAINR